MIGIRRRRQCSQVVVEFHRDRVRPGYPFADESSLVFDPRDDDRVNGDLLIVDLRDYLPELRNVHRPIILRASVKRYER